MRNSEKGMLVGDMIQQALESSKSKRKNRKKATFNGQFEAGYIPVNYTVEWI